MNSQLQEAFDVLYANEVGGWTPSSIIIPARLHDSSGECSICTINLIDYIGKESLYGCKIVKGNRDMSMIDQGHVNPVVFPEITSYEPESRKIITDALKKACRAQGFELIGSFEGAKDQNFRIKFKCDKKKLYKPPNKVDATSQGSASASKKTRHTFTKKPTAKTEACQFSFQLNFRAGRWTFKTGTGNPCHCNHVQKTESEMQTRLRELTDESRKLLESSFRSFAPPSCIRAVLANHNSVSLSSNQIEYLAGLMRLQDPSRPRESPAELLLSDFRNDPTISFIAVYDNVDSSLLSINNKGRPPKISVETSTFNGDARLTTEHVVDPSNWASHGESVTSYAQRVRDNLTVEDGKILLCLAWTSTQEQDLFGSFPEVMAADVTLQTNTEKRPVFMVAGKDNCNRTFTFLKAYLPSESAWVFDWIWSTAMPSLFPVAVLERNKLCITDGDSCIYLPFEDAVTKKVFPNSKHFLCAWHKIDRGMLSNSLSKPAKDTLAESYYNVLKQWLWSWTDSIESEMEFRHSFSLLRIFLASNEVKEFLGEVFIKNFKAFYEISVKRFLSKKNSPTGKA